MEFSSILPWAIFGAITVMLWAMFLFFTGDSNRATERLDELRDPRLRTGEGDEGKGNAAMNVLEKAAPTLSKALEPKSDLEKNDARLRLANAGFNAPNSTQLFWGAKMGLGLLCLFIGGAVGLVKYGTNMNGVVTMCIAGGIGFYGPEIWLWMVRKGRMERIFLSLPDALDLMVVCVEAGLGLDAGMRRVSEELSDSAPDLAYEFSLCNMQLQMGRKRREVLRDLGLRTGVDDVRALSAVLIQADKFGSSVAQALRVQSDTMRIKRRQMAEERAQQTSVKMLVPLVLFIFPSVGVVLVGPAAIMMMNNLFKE